MLKPCLNSRELVIRGHCLLLARASTPNHAPSESVGRQGSQVRHKVYKSAWRDARRDSKGKAFTPTPPEPNQSPPKSSDPVPRLAHSSSEESVRSPPKSSKTAPRRTHSSSSESNRSSPKFSKTAPLQAHSSSEKPKRSQPTPSEAIDERVFVSPLESRTVLAEKIKDVGRKNGVGTSVGTIRLLSDPRYVKYRKLIMDPVKPTPNRDLSSTRPAKLETPEGPVLDDDGKITTSARAKYLYALGRAYLTFYKTGLKNIWNNRKEYNEIKARLGRFTPEDAALYGGQTVSESDPQRIPTITRREYQLYLRTKHDLGKLLPFSLVFLICGEFTPLVVLALGSRVVPYTCRIPRQQEKDRKWFLNRISEETFTKLKILQDTAKPWERSWEAAFLHGIAPTLRPPIILGRLLYLLWINPRVRRRGREILADMVLIRREGGFAALEPIEISAYANKFFFPAFLFVNKGELRHHGKVIWSDDAAKALAPMLEKHAALVLVKDWETIPEQSRHGLILDLPNFQTLLNLEKTREEPPLAPR